MVQGPARDMSDGSYRARASEHSYAFHVKSICVTSHFVLCFNTFSTETSLRFATSISVFDDGRRCRWKRKPVSRFCVLIVAP